MKFPLTYNRKRAAGAMCREAADRSESLDSETILGMIAEQRLTFMEIARILIPDEVESNPKLAQMIIAHVARNVLSIEHLEEVRKNNRKVGASNGGLAFRVEPAEKYPELGKKLIPTEPMPQKMRWSTEEEGALLILGNDPELLYKHGMHMGNPCWPVICHILNVRHHACKAVRNENQCCRAFKRFSANDESDANLEISLEAAS